MEKGEIEIYQSKTIVENVQDEVKEITLEAARKTIDYRLSHGGGHTGWSRAWIINFFARLQDGKPIKPRSSRLPADS